MKWNVVFLVVGLLVAGCSRKTDEFESRIESVRLGTSKEQVEQTLGKPSFIHSLTNHLVNGVYLSVGTWLAGIAEVWAYWADDTGQIVNKRDGHRKGSVCFDANGKVQYVFGGTAYRLEPPRYPIDSKLVDHFRESLLETYNLKVQQGEVAKPATSNAILFSLPVDYHYPNYSNEQHRTMIEVKTDSGVRVSYAAQLSQESDPWKRNWTFKYNGAQDAQGIR